MDQDVDQLSEYVNFLNKGILNHQKKKLGPVEKNEKLYIIWRVLATLEQLSKHSQIKQMAGNESQCMNHLPPSIK